MAIIRLMWSNISLHSEILLKAVEAFKLGAMCLTTIWHEYISPNTCDHTGSIHFHVFI